MGYTVMCESNESDDSVFGFNMFRFEIDGTQVDRWGPPYFGGATNKKGLQLGMPDLSDCGETKTLDVTRYSEEGLCGSLKIELTVNCPLPRDCQAKQEVCFVDDHCCSNLMCKRNPTSLKPGRCVPQPNQKSCVRTNGECGPGKNRCCLGNMCKKQYDGQHLCLPKPADKCIKENSVCDRKQIGFNCCAGLSCEDSVDGEEARCVPAPICGKKLESCGGNRSPECCSGMQCNDDRLCVPDSLEVTGFCYDPNHGLIREGSCKNVNTNQGSSSACCNEGLITITN